MGVESVAFTYKKASDGEWDVDIGKTARPSVAKKLG